MSKCGHAHRYWGEAVTILGGHTVQPTALPISLLSFLAKAPKRVIKTQRPILSPVLLLCVLKCHLFLMALRLVSAASASPQSIRLGSGTEVLYQGTLTVTLDFSLFPSSHQ